MAKRDRGERSTDKGRSRARPPDGPSEGAQKADRNGSGARSGSEGGAGNGNGRGHGSGGSETKRRPGRGDDRHDPLRQGRALFVAGDYVGARPLVLAGSKDETISETQRAFARSILEAMALDRVTLLVGFACVGLALLVVITTAFLQP